MAEGRARRRHPANASLSMALLAAEAAESKRAEAVVVLDLRDQTLITDYFVICTGTSRVQIRAIVDGVAEALADRKSTRLNSSHIQKSRMPSSA